MPQLDRALIKERAKRLRDKGDAALAAHLASEVGARRRVLTERGGIGHTEQFLTVKLAAPLAPGAIPVLEMTSHDGHRLLAA